jgi:hypothetical protein
MTKARQRERQKARAAAAKAEAVTPPRRGPKVTKMEYITSAEAGELLGKLLDPPTSH